MHGKWLLLRSLSIQIQENDYTALQAQNDAKQLTAVVGLSLHERVNV